MRQHLERLRPATFLLAALVLLAPRAALCRGETNEEDAMDRWLSRRAPLTLSGDGRWRLHVDAGGVLNRMHVAEAQPPLRLPLPAGLVPRALAASADGLRVAVLANTGCVAVADFGAAAGRRAITWLPGGLPNAAVKGLARDAIDGAPPEEACQDGTGWPLAVALSPDGRLLATPHQVVEVDSGKTVATLPRSAEAIGARRTFGLRFVDERRLFTAGATLGEGYESPSSPSELQFALWDLDTGGLLRLVHHPADWLLQATMYFHELVPAQGLLTWVDGRRHLAAHRSGRTEADDPVLLDLVQTDLGDCTAAPRRRLGLDPRAWSSLVMDPAGRWLAGLRRLPDPASGAESGPEALWVLDTAQGRVLQKLPLRGRVDGLLALPDGSAVLALQRGPTRGGEVQRFAIDRSRLPAARPSAAAPPPLPGCRIDDETAQARSVQLGGPVLRPLWTLALKITEPDVGGPRSFQSGGRRLWVDQGDELVWVDPLSGRALGRWPTPRSAQVRSLVVPEAGGFVNHQGDTLSWRPFEPGTAPRRALDVRPGWVAEQLQRIGGVLLVRWRRPAAAAAAGAPASDAVRFASYDPGTLKRLRERDLPPGEQLEDILEDLLPAVKPVPVCRAPASGAAGGFDWRLSHFDSFRAWDCTAGAPRTVFWSHLDVLPKQPLWSEEPIEVQRRTGPLDGHRAVALEGSRVQVFDLAARREIGHVDLPPRRPIMGVHLLAEEGVLLVQLFDGQEPGVSGHLRAFSLEPAR